MRLKLLAAGIMGAALIAPACATAGQVIETANISTANVPFDYAFTLKGFDTSLGALESVTFELQDRGTATVLVSNFNSVAEAFSAAYANIPISVTGPEGFAVSDTITATNISGAVGASVSLTPFNGSPYSNTVTQNFTTGLTAFEGPSLHSFDVSAGAGTYGGTANPGVLFGGTASAGGTFEVIFNYASVPEPGTWAFLMLGVGAIGVAMRRRKDGAALAAA